MGRGVQGMEGWVGDDCFHRFVPTFKLEELLQFRGQSNGGSCVQVDRPVRTTKTRRTRKCPAHNRHDTVKWLAIALLVLRRSVKTGH